MVRQIDQAGGEAVLMRAQYVNGFIDDVIHIDQRIVIGVDQLLLRTVLNLVGVAGRFKLTKLWRIAMAVSRAMTANGVQHNHRVAF